MPGVLGGKDEHQHHDKAGRQQQAKTSLTRRLPLAALGPEVCTVQSGKEPVGPAGAIHVTSLLPIKNNKNQGNQDISKSFKIHYCILLSKLMMIVARLCLAPTPLRPHSNWQAPVDALQHVGYATGMGQSNVHSTVAEEVCGKSERRADSVTLASARKS